VKTIPARTAQRHPEQPAGKIRLGVIMNGVTGRMGTNQHLVRSIVAIREQGGVPTRDGRVIWPDPVLVGRNEDKLRALAERHGIERWTTDLDHALADPNDTIYFDALTTQLRPRNVRAAIAAGKHVYCEKPIGTTAAQVRELVKVAKQTNKVFLAGQQLRSMIQLGEAVRKIHEGAIGDILFVKAQRHASSDLPYDGSSGD